MSQAIQQFLAFDWGKLRVGVASGNSLTKTATQVGTVKQQGAARDAAIRQLVLEWKPAALIVGIPYHPDGATHRNTLHARKFGQWLQNLTGLTVHEVDERYSTTQAKADNPTARELELDALSACIILEQYLRSLPE